MFSSGELPFPLPGFDSGCVWLIGVGPGDPALMTVMAAHGIRAADAVVYDALVDDRVLSLVRPGAEMIFAGKRGGRPSPKQPDITRRLIELANEGKRVARLKGGDPFVFGRGGEEALGMVEAGISFRVVPGVTAGVAGLAYAGMPATHRGANSSIAFVTGHGADGNTPSEVDWNALAKGAEVIVVYMPMGQLGVIVDRLIAGGRAPDQPAALISQATLPEQRVLVTTLAAAPTDAQREKVKTPALFAVGPIVSLRSQLDWIGVG